MLKWISEHSMNNYLYFRNLITYDYISQTEI